MKCSTGDKCSDENCTCGWGNAEHSGMIDESDHDIKEYVKAYGVHESEPSRITGTTLFKLVEEKKAMELEGIAKETHIADVFRDFRVVSDDPEIQIMSFLTQAMNLLGKELPVESGRDLVVKDRIAKWFFHKYSIGIPADK